MHPICRFAFAALCGVVAAAQTCVYTYGTSAQWPTSTVVSGPWNNNPGYQRSQHLVLASSFLNAPTVIRDVSLILHQGWVHYRFQEFTVRMGHTPLTTLSYQFAQNIISPLTEVMRVQGHDLILTTEWSDLEMQTPFQYVPGSGNLLIEVECRNATLEGPSSNLAYASAPGSSVFGGASTVPTSGSGQPAPRLRLCTDRADLTVHGQGCGTSSTAPMLGLSGSSVLGNQTTFWVSNASTNSLAFLAFGFDNRPPYPIDLTTQGAPGCLQYIPFTVVSAVTTNGIGVGQHVLSIPASPGLIGVIVMGQYVTLAPTANNLGVLTSNYGRALVGR